MAGQKLWGRSRRGLELGVRLGAGLHYLPPYLRSWNQSDIGRKRLVHFFLKHIARRWGYLDANNYSSYATPHHLCMKTGPHHVCDQDG